MMSKNKNPLLIVLGSNVRKFRKEIGLSQELFAEKAGIDRTYYGGIERGERNVSAINLMRIALALGKEVGDLFPPIVITKDKFDTSK